VVVNQSCYLGGLRGMICHSRTRFRSGPGLITVSWVLCDCPPARAA